MPSALQTSAGPRPLATSALISAIFSAGRPGAQSTPGCPWERGINENTNGLLRRTLPKGTDLSSYSQTDLDAIAFHHNAKPRKSLGWKSPAELFLPEGSFDFQAYWATIIKPVALGT